MPLIRKSSYKAPFWLPGGHLQTIWAGGFRHLKTPPGLRRLRLDTPDGDFLDVDERRRGENPGTSKRAVILSHGLEGNCRRPYIIGMGDAFFEAGWDVFARNFRCCGEEPNRTIRMYHSGETGDLKLVLGHCLSLGYSEVLLIGFSMGGNQILKLLGEEAGRIPEQVKGAIAVSTPCDLAVCALNLDKPSNVLYTRLFLKTLREKVRIKHELDPQLYTLKGLKEMRSLKQFDDRYTAPLYGFASAEDYWRKASCLPFLPEIRLPVLIVNALNDPFMEGDCYPRKIAEKSPYVHLELPAEGGHVGFVSNSGKRYWSENRAVDFAREVVGA